jgi:pilus assembly protein CpaB
MNIQNIIESAIRPIKKHKIVTLFACALATGLIAAWGIRSQVGDFLASERAKLVPKVKTVDVVVAKRNLKPGEVVSADTMAVRPFPQEFVASNAIRPDKFDGFIGAKLSQSLQAGEALVSASMAGADIATFSSKVKPGIRAMTVTVDEVNSVSGMLQPGDHIDLLLSVKPPVNIGAGPAAQGPEVTMPLLQDVLVLATGKQVRPGQGDDLSNRSFAAITVEVSPEQAQKLVVAQRGGKLTAMLRNPGDHTELTKQSLDIYALLGIRPPPMTLVAPQPQPQPAPIPPAFSAAISTVPIHLPAQHLVVSTPPGAEIIVGGRGPIAKPSGLPGGSPESPESNVPASLGRATVPPVNPSKAPISSEQVSQNGLPQSLIEVR